MSELAKALVEAQKVMPEVPKNAKANYGNYATLDDLISKTRPVLNAHGLSIQQFPHVTEQGHEVLRTIVRHVSGDEVAADTPLILGAKRDMQALGAAITYARRYAWGAALGIASEHDDDANSIVYTNGVKGPSTVEPHFDTPAKAPAPATFGGTDPGEVIIQFGKHKGVAIKDAPKTYLAWLLSQEPPKTDAQKAFRSAVELFLVGVTSDAVTEVPGEFSDIDVPF